MYKKIIFETADEFFGACDPIRDEDDPHILVPSTVSVVLPIPVKMHPLLSALRLTGEGSEKFMLSHEITMAEMIEAAFRHANSNAEIVEVKDNEL